MTCGTVPLGNLDALVTAFEAGAIPPIEISHERHVIVAWGLAQRHGPEKGLERMIGQNQAMAARTGRPDACDVTITKAWFDLIATVDDLESAPELLDKTIIHWFYSPERLENGHDC